MINKKTISVVIFILAIFLNRALYSQDNADEPQVVDSSENNVEEKTGNEKMQDNVTHAEDAANEDIPGTNSGEEANEAIGNGIDAGGTASGTATAGTERKLPPPHIAVTKAEFTDKIRIKWRPVPEADKYFIYRSAGEDPSSEEAYESIAQNRQFAYDDTEIEPGKKYHYRIKAWAESEFSEFSNIDSGYLKLQPPIPSASSYTEHIALKWEKVNGAEYYVIYRSEQIDGEYLELTETDMTDYKDADASPGKKYFYKITSWAEAAGYSDLSSAAYGIKALAIPHIEISKRDLDNITISWKEIPGAEKYIIFGKAADAENFSQITETEGISWSIGAKDADKKNTYKIKAKTGDSFSGFSNALTIGGMKSKTGLYLRGMIPGWGQFYAGETIGGFLYSGSFLLSAALIAGTAVLRNNAWNEYESLGHANTKDEFDESYSKYRLSTYGLRMSIGLSGIVYALNWVDVLFFTKGELSNTLGQEAGYHCKPYLNLSKSKNDKNHFTFGLRIDF